MDGRKRTEFGDEVLEASILGINKGPGDGFELVTIETSRGRVECRYYTAEDTNKAVIMVGGIGGGFDTPADDLYPRLCMDLLESGISSLRVSFRYPTDLAEATMDVLVGIDFIKGEGITELGLIGHSFGGAVVVQAAHNENVVKTIVTLSTQSLGVSPISNLAEGVSVLLIHGDEDKTLPSGSSVYAYSLAHEPKKLTIYEGAGHSLTEVSDEVYKEVKSWIKNYLI
ncbi:alpha/beta hydrolase [Methanosarcina sp. DH2]|uniref:alpha/beta hydrolase n=1 Tax=Methanosarcina sp. DH2 TaxID=2605639 RepID=UPI001E36A87E|nr:dienelactone hydrolase family protein [Methanosarcina sp. DH2]MCC4770099.1 alpha/beta hydrolase [Methanosarcina sp. DH2]